MTDAVSFVETVERRYAALTADTGSREMVDSGGEPSLGGKLLYAGELDSAGRTLVVAGNIAGAATLATTADPDAQKQVRDGVVDFLVSSLDEALRILKNEIRKRATVAVCVAVAPSVVEHEMRERGVLPDLVPVGVEVEFGAGSERVEIAAAKDDEPLLCWKVDNAPARWMPKLDSIVLGCLPTNTWTTRWLRLAGRYCGRAAQGVRVLRCDPHTAKRIVDAISGAMKRGEIGVQVEIGSGIEGRNLVEVVQPPAERTVNG